MHSCNLCGSHNLTPLINFGSHPISHHFLKNPNLVEDQYDIDLQFCEECGLTQIVEPVDPKKFYTQLFALSSWKNQPHIPHEVELIRNLPNISENSQIVEIASNDGTFCRALLDAGFHRTVGIEPAKDAQVIAREKRGVNTIGAFFNVETAKKIVDTYGRADIVVARQVLEHISDLKEIQRALKIILAPGGYLFLEVPDFSSWLHTFDYTIWEEHVNQFTPDTLKVFTDGIGIEIIHSESIVYSGESFLIIGINSGKTSSLSKLYLPELRKANILYKDAWPALSRELKEYLGNHKRNGGRIGIYGAGSRVCALVNYIGLGSYIDCFVDDQMEKQGLYMPGSHLPIFPSTHLYTAGITLCLLAVNTENEDKVIAKHVAWMKDGGRFYSIYPPSQRLLPVWEKFLHGPE